ncbi:MAG: VOC family protein, partial [Methyloligellaceae bacterium]
LGPAQGLIYDMKLIPLLNISDMSEAIRFYEDLGFSVESHYAEDGERIWVRMASGDAELMLNVKQLIQPTDRHARAHFSDLVLYVYVDDIRDTHAGLAAKDWRVTDVESQDYGLDEFYVRDPSGYQIAIVSPSTTDANVAG